MNNLELVQYIGNEVCEGCGPDADCGENPEECFRIHNAINKLVLYVDGLFEEATT